MSRIYFHSRHGTSEVSGSERAHMACIIADIAACFHPSNIDDPLRNVLPENCFVLRGHSLKFAELFRTWVMVSDGEFIIDGKPIAKFDVMLNTAIAIGADPLKLFARLHGQCEIHCWVEGRNRAWLAGIIDAGLSSGLYRRKLCEFSIGWEETVKLLRSRDDEPVVCSYSVCDQFPSRWAAGWKDDCDGDAWYELSEDDRWSLAMGGMRGRYAMQELKPDGWNEYRFGHTLNAFDIVQAANKTVQPQKVLQS